MADLTVTASPQADGRVRYELGRANWGAPVPDLRRLPSTVTVGRLVDVVVLGDGYTSEVGFRAQLDRWLQAFFALRAYDTFAGAFRIRALFTPSDGPASGDRRSFYRCALTDGDAGVRKDGWWHADDDDGRAFRRRLWESVDSFDGVDLRRYSADLDVGDGGAVRDEHLRDTYRNLVVAMLVRTASSENVSGMTTNVRRDPGQQLNGRVAFGANAIHEFSHGFGFLSDEYIDGRDRANSLANPAEPSVLTLSNLSFSDRDGSVPWAHLAPTGRFRRSSGSGAPPVAGWLWVGGVVHTGAWHSEYRCLMNGTHDNYAFTQVESEDPTANADGTYTDEHGATLRDVDRFCAWCQEIVTIRILEKTDQLAEPGDPADPTEQGRTWFARWESELRENYHALFAVGQQIRDAEARYATTAPGRHGEPLWRSDLYQVPRASGTQESGSVGMLDDGETYLLLGYTAIP